MSARSKSRSPLRGSDEPYDIESCFSDDDDPAPSSDCRKIKIDNYPSHWKYSDIKQFIKDRTNSSVISDNIKYVNYNKKQINKITTSTVEFSDANICRQAYNQLKARQHEKCEGHTIFVKWERSKQTNKNAQNKNSGANAQNKNSGANAQNRNSGARINYKKQTFKPSRPQMSLDTYGLSLQFLDQLGIKLPLLNKIFVANLDKQVDDAKLREIFGNAGQILDTFMISKENKAKMAKIEYDHPLEAVQAISMFHNQELYGRILAVQMDNSPVLHSKPLPTGLASIGPGLGPNGEALKGIRYVAELQPLKEYVSTEIAKLKALINPSSAMTQNDSNIHNIMNQAIQSMTPLNINTMNPLNQAAAPMASSFMNAQGNSQLQMLQGLLQQNLGSDLTTTLAALQSQALAPSLAGFGQYGSGLSDWSSQTQAMSKPSQQSTQSSDNGGQSNSGFDKRSRNSEDSERKIISTDMLIFTNLPSSVTLTALKKKMREVGDVKFAEITDEGKAIVRFHSTQDAERCVNLFDRSMVDGETIHVRFF